MLKKLTYFYLIPLWLMFAVNCVFSLTKTTYFELYVYNEIPRYKNDHPVILLILLGIFMVLAFKGSCLLDKACMTVKRLRIISSIWALLLSSFFVLLFRCGVTCDSEFLSNCAVEFMQNNYAAFAEGEYLHHYPFQLGMVALLEIVYRIFGVENYLAFQFLNVVAIAGIIYLLNLITEELFDEPVVAKIEAVLSFGMLPLYLFATFIYGDVISIALGTGAVYFCIRYLKYEKIWDFLIAGALFTPAAAVKTNIYVWLVAFAIAIIIKMLQNKKWILFPLLIVFLLSSWLGREGIEAIYANRADMDGMWDGVPKVAWVAMSLQEADEDENGCGWYNGYNWTVYDYNDYDEAATTKACIENIEESLVRFVNNPKDAVYFFYKKFVSQWNAPTFQAMITNEWYSRYTENRYVLGDFLIYGFGRTILYQLMNFYHLIMFALSAAGCWYIMKNWRLERVYLVLNIFGGFLFHMIWEAQSRYILGYYVLMLPVAAIGLKYCVIRKTEKSHEIIG